MNVTPIVDEWVSTPAVTTDLFANAKALPATEADLAVTLRAGVRRFSIYAPSAAFGLAEELDFLTRRSIEQNVFFAPQFLIPAMPRLDERKVRLMVVRDEAGLRSRLRFLMPYSVERAGLFGGPATLRAWTHPFGPLGTPLVDADDPAGHLRSLLAAMAKPEFALPDILVLPDLRIDEPFAQTLLDVAETLGLPVSITNRFDRAAFVPKGPGTDPIAEALSGRRLREVRRQRRLLEAQGSVSFETARDGVAVRGAMEEFLGLEAGGWKGQSRSALLLDRYRAAFARESVDELAKSDRVRIFTLRLNGHAIASLVVFVLNGEAVAWKTAYDEAYGAASPGLQVLIEATRALAADESVRRVDSCTVPDHFVMNRLWKDRVSIATLVVGLKPGSAARVEAAARGAAQTRNARNLTRLVKLRMKAMIGLR